jgi:hypothetical protein
MNQCTGLTLVSEPGFTLLVLAAPAGSAHCACTVLLLPTSLQAKKWRAYFSFPRCVRDLFSNTLLLVGLPPQLRQNEGALRAALSKYGTVASLQVRCQLMHRTRGTAGDLWQMCCPTSCRLYMLRCRVTLLQEALLRAQCVDCTNNLVKWVFRSICYLLSQQAGLLLCVCVGVSPWWAQPPWQ